MVKKILLGIVAALAVFAVVVILQPSDFRVARSTMISAPAPVVFAQVNDLHQWDNWSPWAKLDPQMKTTHAGAPAGKGAAYTWSGNDKVGEGRMTIIESRPNELVRIKLEFIKPFAASNTTEFTFTSDAGRTSVTWSMAGENNFLGKAVCLFMNMDKMVGGDFEKGLVALKSVAESATGK